MTAFHFLFDKGLPATDFFLIEKQAYSYSMIMFQLI